MAGLPALLRLSVHVRLCRRLAALWSRFPPVAALFWCYWGVATWGVMRRMSCSGTSSPLRSPLVVLQTVQPRQPRVRLSPAALVLWVRLLANLSHAALPRPPRTAGCPPPSYPLLHSRCSVLARQDFASTKANHSGSASWCRIAAPPLAGLSEPAPAHRLPKQACPLRSALRGCSHI